MTLQLTLTINLTWAGLVTFVLSRYLHSLEFFIGRDAWSPKKKYFLLC